MKKLFFTLLVASIAICGFAKDKKQVKFSSSSLSSRIKCEKLAGKAFGDNFQKSESPDKTLTLWYCDDENFIYFFENGKRGENRDIQAYGKIGNKAEYYSAYVTKFINETAEEYITLGTKDKQINVSDNLDKAFSYTENENFPSKQEWKEILLKRRKEISRYVVENMLSK